MTTIILPDKNGNKYSLTVSVPLPLVSTVENLLLDDGVTIDFSGVKKNYNFSKDSGDIAATAREQLQADFEAAFVKYYNTVNSK